MKPHECARQGREPERRHQRARRTRSHSCRCTATWPRSPRPWPARRPTTAPVTRTSTSRPRPAAEREGDSPRRALSIRVPQAMDPRSDSESSWLAALLAPVSPDEFLSRYWAKQHLLLPRCRRQILGLLSWTVAQRDCSAHHWREPRRFRLARQGRDLDPASYSDIAASHARIRASDVTDQLRRGATLSFDAIDELHEPLTRLSESFETFFRSDTQINLYAAWRALHGLDLHRDDQEVFILHLEGRKRWLLYGFSVDGVDRTGLGSAVGAAGRRIARPGPRARRSPVHPQGLLSRGGADERAGASSDGGRQDPSRHGSVAVDRQPAAHARNGRPRAAALRTARRTAPLREELRRALLDGLVPDLVEQYFCETGGNSKTRPSFNLPWSATPEGLPAGNGFLVRLKGRCSHCRSRWPGWGGDRSAVPRTQMQVPAKHAVDHRAAGRQHATADQPT